MTGVAALLAGLGFVGLSFGVLSALMAILQPYTDPLWILGHLFVGVVLLGSAVLMSLDSLRERLRSSGSQRAGKVGSSAIANAILSILILIGLGFLSVRYAHRFDVSEAGVHTMAPQTTELLAGLGEDVSITALFSEAEAPAVRDLLDRYAYESDRIQLRFVDPNSAPGLVASLEISSEDLARGVVRLSLSSGEAISLSEFSEAAVTNAIRKLVRSTGKKIYFLKGHNERGTWLAADAEGADQFGTAGSFSRAAQALQNETYAVDSLLLATLADVPRDASALIIAGPTNPLLENELVALQRYVDAGGGLFVAIDPRSHSNVDDLLSGWGISFGDDIIVDRALAVYGQATTPLATEYDVRHPITSRLHEPTLFPLVRSVTIDPSVRSNYSELVKTGPESWAERDLETWQNHGRAEWGAEDLEGPVTIAIAGTPPAVHNAAGEGAPTGRIVVFGDSDFAANEFIDALRNRDLFVNSMNWLAGDVDQISLRPNFSRASNFQMSQEEFRRIQLLSLFVLPEAIAILGVFVWWRRRSVPNRFEA
jgi:ABC-type uncharacterized transport system involved in gliding motility auxiliary subunit